VYVLKDKQGWYCAWAHNPGGHMRREGRYNLCKDVKSVTCARPSSDGTIPIGVFVFEKKGEATRAAKKVNNWPNGASYRVVEVAAVLESVIVGFREAEPT